MLGYYISQSNQYAIRTEPTASNQLTMSLQDMYTLASSSVSMSGLTYNGYESLLEFTASISGAYEGAEYRATLLNQSGSASIEIWHGSIQVYKSSSVGKEEYENQIPPVTSHASENRYIILD
jgi:hypothetical protein